MVRRHGFGWLRAIPWQLLPRYSLGITTEYGLQNPGYEHLEQMA